MREGFVLCIGCFRITVVVIEGVWCVVWCLVLMAMLAVFLICLGAVFAIVY